MSGVGTWVVLAGLVLAAGFRTRASAGSIDPAGQADFGALGWVVSQAGGGLLGNAAGVAAIVVAVVLIQLPFDLVGGYVLPRKHGRTADRFGAFAWRWLRGVSVYAGAMLGLGLPMLGASALVGGWGMAGVGVAASMALLAFRTPLARAVGGLSRATAGGLPDGADAAPFGRGMTVLSADDGGFTGGTGGVLSARSQILPDRWVRQLEPEELLLVIRRRREAAVSGLWLRGRLGALAFVWIGLVVSGLVSTGVEPTGVASGASAGSAEAVLRFAAVFTLWSFVGLLVLPTLSRRASLAIDERLRAGGVDASDLRSVAMRLDTMQDGEPDRPGWIEAVFHPIPSVASRRSRGGGGRLAAWDIARTAAFLGLCGLSPLGRAVHCNSGRPALWVYLPLD
ncbi:MAG: hypothetical protein AAGF47_08750 [Planctomycetota bacterium]